MAGSIRRTPSPVAVSSRQPTRSVRYRLTTRTLAGFVRLAADDSPQVSRLVFRPAAPGAKS
jgi:hypothetical protein